MRAFRKAVRITVGVLAVFMLLFWSLTPLAQHEIDRSLGFWLGWSVVEVILALISVASFRGKAEIDESFTIKATTPCRARRSKRRLLPHLLFATSWRRRSWSRQ